MLFDDVIPQDDEEERRRRLLLGGLAPSDNAYAAGKAAATNMQSAMESYWRQQPDIFGSDFSGDTYQPPMNSMKPGAIVPSPTEPMPGTSTTYQLPLASMTPQSVASSLGLGMAAGVPMGDAATERQPLWANLMGPAAPGQRVSGTKLFDNGVTINDGFSGSFDHPNLLTPTPALSPGAGYNSPHPGDMDWGNRAAQEPYTNPLVQNMIRDHAMKMELQQQALDSHLLQTEIATGNKSADKKDEARTRAIKAAGDLRLSPEARKAIINGIGDLSSEDKQSFALEADTMKYGKDGKPVRMGLGNEKSFGELLPRIHTADPSVAQRFLETRGITADDAIERMNLIEEKKRNMPWNRPTPSEMTELEALKHLYGDQVENTLADAPNLDWIMSSSKDKYRKRSSPGSLTKDEEVRAKRNAERAAAVPDFFPSFYN